jgi:hypothetical protein
VTETATLTQMWLAGASTDEIAETLGVSEATVRSRSSTLGLPLRHEIGDVTLIWQDRLLDRLREVHPLEWGIP